MARKRFITEFSRKGASVKVYYTSEYQEYVTQVYRSGKHYEPADYFTDCRDDAMRTARTMLDEETRRIETSASYKGLTA